MFIKDLAAISHTLKWLPREFKESPSAVLSFSYNKKLIVNAMM